MPGAKEYKLDQVAVRLKLTEEAPLYSTESVNTPQKAVDIMREMMKDLDREHVCVVNLDGALHPVNFNIVSIGDVNSSPITMRELFKAAILSNAGSIMMFHNHPSSSLKPSLEDHKTTARVMAAGETMGIPLLDHIIVGGGTGDYFSFKEAFGEQFTIRGIQKTLEKLILGDKSKVAESRQEYRTDRPSLLARMKEKKTFVEERARTRKPQDHNKNTDRSI